MIDDFITRLKISDKNIDVFKQTAPCDYFNRNGKRYLTKAYSRLAQTVDEAFEHIENQANENTVVGMYMMEHRHEGIVVRYSITDLKIYDSVGVIPSSRKTVSTV